MNRSRDYFVLFIFFQEFEEEEYRNFRLCIDMLGEIKFVVNILDLRIFISSFRMYKSNR